MDQALLRLSRFGCVLSLKLRIWCHCALSGIVDLSPSRVRHVAVGQQLFYPEALIKIKNSAIPVTLATRNCTQKERPALAGRGLIDTRTAALGLCGGHPLDLRPGITNVLYTSRCAGQMMERWCGARSQRTLTSGALSHVSCRVQLAARRDATDCGEHCEAARFFT